ERRADARDLVLGLERVDVELLQAGELVQHVARGRDRIAAEEERTPGLARGGDEAERRRGVSRDVAVLPGRDRRRADRVRHREDLRVLGEVLTGAERAEVRLDQVRRLLELVADP